MQKYKKKANTNKGRICTPWSAKELLTWLSLLFIFHFLQWMSSFLVFVAHVPGGGPRPNNENLEQY